MKRWLQERTAGQYEGELLFTDRCQRLLDMACRLVSIMEGFANRETAQLLQIGGIGHRYIDSSCHNQETKA